MWSTASLQVSSLHLTSPTSRIRAHLLFTKATERAPSVRQAAEFGTGAEVRTTLVLPSAVRTDCAQGGSAEATVLPYLCHAETKPIATVRELDLTETALRSWVRHAKIDC